MKNQTKTSSNFDVDGLIAAITERVWKAEGYPGDPEPPTLQQLQDTAIATHETENVSVYINDCSYYVVLDTTRIVCEEKTIASRHFVGGGPEYYEPVARHLLRTAGEPRKECLSRLHDTWKGNQKNQKKTPAHPLRLVIHAWIQQQQATRITPKRDEKRPVAILDPKSMGSVRDVINTSGAGVEELDRIKGFSAEAPETQQIVFPEIETENVLPQVLPLQAVSVLDGIETTKAGAVSMPIRLFFESVMALEPNETKATLHFKLGDLLRFLNPDGKYNRTNHLPYVLKGLHSLYALRVPYRENPDDPATEVDWIPVLPRTVPNERSGNDAPIILEVKLPPNATGGMMVEKDILRITGKKSSAQFNAYLTACYLFDTYGTTPKGIIDPTKPAEHRDADGYLTTPTGEKLYTDKGRRVKNRYHPANLGGNDRVKNEARTKYPVLSFDELTRACYPKGFDKRKRKTYQERAKKAWTQLESEGIVRIERLRHGWRIMPSENHIGRYRGIRNAP